MLARSWPRVKTFIGHGYASRRALWFSSILIFGTPFKLLFYLFLLSLFSFTSSIMFLPPSPSFLASLFKYDSPPSHTCFFVYALMVDYSKIRHLFPSISFFFSCLGAFLESSSGHHPRVRLFAS